MRFTDLLLATFALRAAASSFKVRGDEPDPSDDDQEPSDDDGYGGHHDDHDWPISKAPHFFNLKVDEKCEPDEPKDSCPFDNYAIRLERGIVIATPYNKWWDPKLATFFVDDDTQCYTVRCMSYT